MKCYCIIGTAEQFSSAKTATDRCKKCVTLATVKGSANTLAMTAKAFLLRKQLNENDAAPLALMNTAALLTS